MKKKLFATIVLSIGSTSPTPKRIKSLCHKLNLTITECPEGTIEFIKNNNSRTLSEHFVSSDAFLSNDNILEHFLSSNDFLSITDDASRENVLNNFLHRNGFLPEELSHNMDDAILSGYFCPFLLADTKEKIAYCKEHRSEQDPSGQKNLEYLVLFEKLIKAQLRHLHKQGHTFKEQREYLKDIKEGSSNSIMEQATASSQE